MTELKPCPFCGGEARIEAYGMGYVPECDHRDTCHIANYERPANEWYTSEGFAVQAWNARWERTCHSIKTWFKCSECRAEYDEWDEHGMSDNVNVLSLRYCPNCGAKVVER